MGSNAEGQLGLPCAWYETAGPSAWLRSQPTAVQLAALGSGVVQVAAGDGFSAALTAGGEVYLWGNNADGQLGNGECSRAGSNCLGINVAAPTRLAALGTDTVQLALGSYHVLARKQGGAVFSWGRGDNGQLGLGDTDNRLSPTEVISRPDHQPMGSRRAHRGTSLQPRRRLGGQRHDVRAQWL
eukprot:COSAG04_NODE_11_length_42922_cov_38.819700_28_plen_184_part_00